MARTELSDELWTQLKNTMKHGCYIIQNTHIVMAAILWKLRTGTRWWDIPEELASWKTTHNCFNRWSDNGQWEKFFSLRKEVDTEWVLIEASYLKLCGTKTCHTPTGACGYANSESQAVCPNQAMVGGPPSRVHHIAFIHNQNLSFQIGQ